MKNTMEAYLNAVSKKLSDPATQRLMQFGTVTPIAGERMLRDADGMTQTLATIMTSARNLHFATEGRDEVAKKFANFAATGEPNTGYDSVVEVKTVGAIDLTIISMAKSIIPFVAVDRGMDMPEATIYYNDLVSASADGVGGVNKGEVVQGNFSVPNAKVEIGADNEELVTLPISDKYIKIEGITAAPGRDGLIPGKVAVKITSSDGTKTVEGRDYAGDGNILFPAGSGIESATVDYSNGKIDVTAADSTDFSGGTAVVSYVIDQAADNAGESTLTVVPKWTGIPLKSVPQNIILQDNLANRMYMAKAQTLATGGKGGMSQADILFARTKDVYIEYLNKKVLRELVKGKVTAALTKTGGVYNTPAEADLFLDLSGYSLANWASTKNDMIIQAITSLQARFLGSIGLAGTVIVTGTLGVSLLSCVPFMWTPNPEVNQGVNGLAGYFNGLPIYRHTYIDAVTPAGAAEFFLACKLADNNSGSMVYGEFLPMTSTGVVSNFAQPQNISNGFFSQTAAKKVQDALVKKLSIALPAGLFGSTVVRPNL